MAPTFLTISVWAENYQTASNPWVFDFLAPYRQYFAVKRLFYWISYVGVRPVVVNTSVCKQVVCYRMIDREKMPGVLSTPWLQFRDTHTVNDSRGTFQIKKTKWMTWKCVFFSVVEICLIYNNVLVYAYRDFHYLFNWKTQKLVPQWLAIKSIDMTIFHIKKKICDFTPVY